MSEPNQGDVTCPSCGNVNRGGAKFCRRCGAVLSAAAPMHQETPPASREDAPSAPVPQQEGSPAPAVPPTILGAPAIHGGAPAAPPPRRGIPWLLLFGGAAVALLLLVACVGSALWYFGVGRSPGPPSVAAPIVLGPTSDPGSPPGPGASADRTATAEARSVAATVTAEARAGRQTATARAQATTAASGAAGVDADATATAEARAELQTAMAAARATPEVTPEPTPAPTPEPAGLVPAPGALTLADYQAGVEGQRQRLFETFDRGERTKAIWTQFENDSVAARLRDNFYALTVKGESKNMWETWERDLGEDYNVELAVAFQDTGVPTTVGIAFDVQAEGDNGVFFEIFNDKHWQLRTVQDGRLVREHTTGRIPVPEAQDGVGTNILWVVRRPDGVQLWINSVHVATVPAGPFAGGRAGVVASSREGLSGQATVIADNFRVRTP
jgi:hypothetical protein